MHLRIWLWGCYHCKNSWDWQVWRNSYFWSCYKACFVIVKLNFWLTLVVNLCMWNGGVGVRLGAGRDGGLSLPDNPCVNNSIHKCGKLSFNADFGEWVKKSENLFSNSLCTLIASGLSGTTVQLLVSWLISQSHGSNAFKHLDMVKMTCSTSNWAPK